MSAPTLVRGHFTGLLATALLLFACSGTRPGHIGDTEPGLAPCPPTPNCVVSDATDAEHEIAPLVLAVSADEGWLAARQAVLELPRTVIVIDDADYLHAESTSAMMRYVDDLELRLHPDGKVIEVRSASRLGRSDLGVNRKRVERLRSALIGRGVVR